MRAADQCSAGFTLLEALVALAILTGATASLMTLIATNRRAQAAASTDVAAALHARTILARIGRDLPLEIGTRSGMFEDGGSWLVRIAPFRPEPGSATMPDTTLLEVRLRLLGGAVDTSPVEVATLKKLSR